MPPTKGLEALTECDGFQWDTGNLDKIRERHGVAPQECEEVFLNRPLLVDADRVHSQSEDRSYALGQTDAGRLLFVVFTIRGKLIRGVSARDMNRKERRIYRSL